MKKLLLSFALFYGTFMSAQNKFIVTSSGMSFSPSSITINQGDTVEWQNISGVHNVNGNQATYPANPTSFGNGAASSSSWTYSIVFNTVGTYTYQCDIHVGGGMIGTVTVQLPAQINEITSKSNIKIFPNPATDYFTVNANQSLTKIMLYNSTGKLIKTYPSANNYDIKGMLSGIYFLKIETRGVDTVEKLIIK